MANTSAVWQQASNAAYQLSSPSWSTGSISKSLTLKIKIKKRKRENFLGENVSRRETSQRETKKEKSSFYSFWENTLDMAAAQKGRESLPCRAYRWWHSHRADIFHNTRLAPPPVSLPGDKQTFEPINPFLTWTNKKFILANRFTW